VPGAPFNTLVFKLFLRDQLISPKEVTISQQAINAVFH